MAIKTKSPFAAASELEGARPQFRFSVGTMLLATFVFSAMGGALFYATRVPMLRAEMNAVLGVTVVDPVSNDRMAHLTFLLYCYSAPLLLTGVFGLGVTLLRRLEKMQNRSRSVEERAWDEDLKKPDTSDPIATQFRITKPKEH